MRRSYWIETLGCPKNQVDSDKLAGSLAIEGYELADGPDHADVVVVNTCAFIEPARAESIETILALSDGRRDGAKLVVTGCLAARAGQELADEIPEIDVVADVGVPIQVALAPLEGDSLAGTPAKGVPAPTTAVRWRPRNGPVGSANAVGVTGGAGVPSLDLLEMPRRPVDAPWAYVKVAEGCDRKCGFCAIPSFRGAQRSRRLDAILAEVDAIGVSEVVLVAQDLASYGRDRSSLTAAMPAVAGIIELVEAVAARVERVRLLYLYPSSLTDGLVEAICATGVPYFDLSLQHVSAPLLRKMRRFGNQAKFTERIGQIRDRAPEAALRSSFILGYPGETEEDHDALLDFLAEVELDWAGFFTYSKEAGTYAADLEGAVPQSLALERLQECAELQDSITARRRQALVGSTVEVLVDSTGVARSHREAPEIDGVIHVPTSLVPGALVKVTITGAEGPDLLAELS